MKHYYAVIVSFLLLCCLFVLFSACKREDPQDNALTVIVPQKVSNIANWSSDETIRQLRGIGEGAFSEVKSDGAGNVVVILQPEQLKMWQERITALLERSQAQLKEYDPDYRLVCNEDCSELNLYVKADMPSQAFANSLLGAENLCALYQLFSGAAPEDWYVVINIYNAASGKLVVSGDSNSRLNFDENDWKASE